MLYGLKKSVCFLQKRNYAPKTIKTLASLDPPIWRFNNGYR